MIDNRPGSRVVMVNLGPPQLFQYMAADANPGGLSEQEMARVRYESVNEAGEYSIPRFIEAYARAVERKREGDAKP